MQRFSFRTEVNSDEIVEILTLYAAHQSGSISFEEFYSSVDSCIDDLGQVWRWKAKFEGMSAAQIDAFRKQERQWQWLTRRNQRAAELLERCRPYIAWLGVATMSLNIYSAINLYRPPFAQAVADGWLFYTRSFWEALFDTVGVRMEPLLSALLTLIASLVLIGVGARSPKAYRKAYPPFAHPLGMMTGILPVFILMIAQLIGWKTSSLYGPDITSLIQQFESAGLAAQAVAYVLLTTPVMMAISVATDLAGHAALAKRAWLGVFAFTILCTLF